MGEINPFKKPKVYKPEPLPPIPAEVKPSSEEVKKSEEEDRQKRFAQRGRAATILGKEEANGGVATKKLLGGK